MFGDFWLILSMITESLLGLDDKFLWEGLNKIGKIYYDKYKDACGEK